MVIPITAKLVQNSFAKTQFNYLFTFQHFTRCVGLRHLFQVKSFNVGPAYSNSVCQYYCYKSHNNRETVIVSAQLISLITGQSIFSHALVNMPSQFNTILFWHSNIPRFLLHDDDARFQCFFQTFGKNTDTLMHEKLMLQKGDFNT